MCSALPVVAELCNCQLLISLQMALEAWSSVQPQQVKWEALGVTHLNSFLQHREVQILPSASGQLGKEEGEALALFGDVEFPQMHLQVVLPLVRVGYSAQWRQNALLRRPSLPPHFS